MKWNPYRAKHLALFAVLVASIVAVSSISTTYAVSTSPTSIPANAKIIFVVPHTHFDPVWLDPWNVEVERWCTNVRTALDTMEQNPTMTYVLDQVCGIQYLWEHYPQYQQEILQMIRAGRIEVVQGFVSMPDENLVGEIGLMNDALAGIQWCHDVLNATVETGWEIDPFGFGAGTPTFYSEVGLKHAIICRVGNGLWDGVFNWTGNDGATIEGYKMPGYCQAFGDNGISTGTEISNVNDFISTLGLWIRSYNDPFQHTVNASNIKNDQGDMMIFYGCDFTNPNWELPGYIAAWNAMYGAKTGYYCEMGTPAKFFARLDPLLARGGVVRNNCTAPNDLNPVFSGCYSSRVATKNFTSYFEQELDTLTTFGVIAKQQIPSFTYPEPDLDTAWFKADVMHHHDAVTGSSTQLVHENNMQFYYQELPVVHQMEGTILGTLAGEINSTYKNQTARPLVLFNTLGWNNTETVSVPVNATDFPAAIQSNIKDVEVIDPATGTIVPSQVEPIANMSIGSTFLDTFDITFTATVPSMGFKTYFLLPIEDYQANTTALTTTISSTGFTMTNGYYTVSFNATAHEELAIKDNTLNWNVLSAQGGSPWQLLAYNDIGDLYNFNFQGIQYNLSTMIPRIVYAEKGPAQAQVTLCYTAAGSQYNRSIIMSVGVKQVAFLDEMSFLPVNSTTVAVRFNFNLQGTVHHAYDEPYGFAIHDDGQFYPALYYMTVSNASVGVNWMNYAIHGFRSAGSEVEGVLVRYCNSDPSLTDKNTNDDYDNGTFSFNYALSTYSVTNQTDENASVRMAYGFNFPLHSLVQDLQATGTLPTSESFYAVNDSRILLLGVQKVPGENQLSMLAMNVASMPVAVHVSSVFPMTGAYNATLVDALGAGFQLSGNGFDMTMRHYGWQNVVIENTGIDINGPSVGALVQDQSALPGTLSFSVNVVGGISKIVLQYCYNETFEGQTWINVTMQTQSLTPVQYRATVSIPVSDLSIRPVYFRVLVIDGNGNERVSTDEMVISSPAFTTTAIDIGLVLSIVLACFIVVVIAFAIRQLNRKASGKKLGNLLAYKKLTGTQIVAISAKEILLQVVLPAILPALVIGTGLGYWAVAVGFFGFPSITSIDPGMGFPGSGDGFPFASTPRTTIFEFFNIGFFDMILVLGVVSFAIVLLLPRSVSMKGRAISALAGTALAPAAAAIVLPMFLLASWAPSSYWAELGNLSSMLYHVGITLMSWWYFLPLAGSGTIVVLGGVLVKWIWADVLPAKARSRVAEAIHVVKEIIEPRLMKKRLGRRDATTGPALGQAPIEEGDQP